MHNIAKSDVNTTILHADIDVNDVTLLNVMYKLLQYKNVYHVWCIHNIQKFPWLISNSDV